MKKFKEGKEKEKQLKEFEEAAQKMVDWLNKYGDPHMTVIITQTHAEALSGEIGRPFPSLDLKGE